MPGASSRRSKELPRIVVIALYAWVSSGLHTEDIQRVFDEEMDAPFLFEEGDHLNNMAGSRLETDITGPPTDNAPCNGSGYFIDWGSSGMKVYRVHRVHQDKGRDAGSLSSGEAVEGSLKAFKLSGVGIESTPEQVKAIFDGLLQHLPPGATRAEHRAEGAVLATAGMRLEPERADALWASVRAWADSHSGFLGRCGKGQHDGCRTLAGTEEAAYEMRSVLRSQPGQELEKSTERFGFASSGGASMQLGIRGPEAELERCRHDLGRLDANFDPRRVDVAKINGVPTLLISFLGVTGTALRLCVETANQQDCDYNVGGLDQMRGRFDDYLAMYGFRGNPCLSEYAELRQDKSCSFFNATHCVLDRYGGKISGLPPVNSSLSGEHRKAECRLRVKRFMDKDLEEHRWSSSPSCKNLAGNVSRWALVSAFSRKAQLGVSVDKWEAFSDVRQAARDLDFATKAESERGKEGTYLTSMLLVHFLEVLGISPSANLRGMEAQWAAEAMHERGLALGWENEGTCSRQGTNRQTLELTAWGTAESS